MRIPSSSSPTTGRTRTGAPRITTEDEAFITRKAKSAPRSRARRFSHWNIAKLRRYLGDIGRERPRQIPDDNEVTFQRTKTGSETNGPGKEELDRIE